jgi:hypothetical protein
MIDDLTMFSIPSQNYYRVGGASEYTGLCPNTIRKYTDLGLIEAKRLPGGDRIYRKDWLDRFMEDLPDAVEACRN